MGAGARRRVVLTGAAGRIGRAVAAALAQRWEWQLTDIVTEARGHHGGEPPAPEPPAPRVWTPRVVPLDVTDGGACRAAFAGADAVVHLAAVSDPDASWDRLLPANVIGTHQVAQAAMDCGVRRLVLASSLQAVSAVDDNTQARAGDPPRPANLYGATKAWAEAIGSWVAATSSTSVVALRIGYYAQDRPIADQVSARELAAWLSPRDAAELVRAAVEAEGIGFVVAHGTSANRYRRADLGETMAVLGYRPHDDAWSAV